MDCKKPLDIFIACGELSGDHLGRSILDMLPKNLFVAGVVGPKMLDWGVKELDSIQQFEIMGFMAYILALPRMLTLLKKYITYILKHDPKVVLLIDNSAFSQRLAKQLKKTTYQGKIVKLVCPQIWAWRKRRKKAIENDFDYLFTLFPFEVDLFDPKKLDVTFIGHPLYNQTTKEIATPLSDTLKGDVISIFPGSRAPTIKMNLPLQLNSVSHLKGYTIAVSVSSPDKQELIESICASFPFEVILVAGTDRHSLMRRSLFAIATPGTLALELAFLEVPSITTYRMKPFTSWLMCYVFSVNLPHYAMPNILAKRRIFPELTGFYATEANLKNEVDNFINFESLREEAKRGCLEVKTIFKGTEPGRVAAEKILTLI